MANCVRRRTGKQSWASNVPSLRSSATAAQPINSGIITGHRTQKAFATKSSDPIVDEV